MPTPTYIPLATITLGSTASSVTFSSIPATYRDLVLVTNAKVTTSAIEMNLIFNGVSTNLSWVRMIGSGSGVSSASFSNPYPTIGDTSSLISVLQIMDYSATDKHKTCLLRQNSVNSSRTEAIAIRYANTAAITSITLDPFSFSLDAGFTASLYGIAG